MKFQTMPWRIPGPERATEGWVEGRPTVQQLVDVRAAAGRARETWKPSNEAWQQLVVLHEFIGKHVRLQFWNPIMIMLEDEGPYPLTCDCRGIVTLLHDGFPQ